MSYYHHTFSPAPLANIIVSHPSPPSTHPPGGGGEQTGGYERKRKVEQLQLLFTRHTDQGHNLEDYLDKDSVEF